MRIISDSDVVERADSAGDVLVLRVAPYQKDVLAVSELEQEQAKAEFKHLKDIGLVDKDASVFDMAKKMEAEDPEAVKKAQANLKQRSDSPAVARLKLEALAVRLVIGGQTHGGKAVMDQYDKMDPASAAWVNEQVKDVWDAAMPGEEEKHCEGADAQVPASTGLSSTEESPKPIPENSAAY